MPVGPLHLTRPKLSHWLAVSVFFFGTGIFLFLYKYLDFVTRHYNISPLIPFIEEMTGVISGAALFVGIHEIAIRFPLIGRGWWRNVPVHLLALIVFSLVHTSFMAWSRQILFPLVGLGRYDYGDMRYRYFMEFSNDVVAYVSMLSLIFLYHYVRYSHQQELDRSRLETNLAQAQLRNLRLQLEPHFLFNALNAISAVVYENPRAADEMIGRLSELLRQLLRQDHSQEITLSEELELVRLYTRIMESRLEDRLQVHFDIDTDASQALVPQLVLQPLVENAIRYGVDPVTFQVDVRISAQRHNGDLHIEVRDHGPGWLNNSAGSGPWHSSGIGLRNTAERLTQLYGKPEALQRRDAVDGGAVVEISLPYRTQRLA